MIAPGPGIADAAAEAEAADADAAVAAAAAPHHGARTPAARRPAATAAPRRARPAGPRPPAGTAGPHWAAQAGSAAAALEQQQAQPQDLAAEEGMPAAARHLREGATFQSSALTLSCFHLTADLFTQILPASLYRLDWGVKGYLYYAHVWLS